MPHTASSDFRPQFQLVTFDPDDSEREISIPVLSDGVVEDMEVFLVQLSLVEGGGRGIMLGQISVTTVTILDSDGTLGVHDMQLSYCIIFRTAILLHCEV